MAEHNDDAILVHLEYIRKASDETNDHLRVLNGRMGAVETRTAILEDRARKTRHSGRNWGLAAGGIGTAIGTAIYTFFKGGP